MKRMSREFALLIFAVTFLAVKPAFADVSNEIVAGTEADSSNEIKQTVDGVTTDLTDAVKITNARFDFRYTRFFQPLKNNGTPIELRRFLEHPSTLSAGLVSVAETIEDKTTPGIDEKIKLNGTLLVFGGEYYLPSNTGLFLNIGFGSGTMKDSVNGAARPELTEDLNTYEFGARQYVAPTVALHVSLTGQKVHAYTTDATPAFTEDMKKNVVLLGADGVIKKVFGLSLEFGVGSKTDSWTGSAEDDFDVGQVNFSAAVYPGKHLSFMFEVKAETATQTGLPSGAEYKESTARATASATYWFTERFGLRLPIYWKSNEIKFADGSHKVKTTEKNSGLGVYAKFRF